jgi:hypothetical protein
MSAAFEREATHARDMVALKTPTGSACSCAELTHAWFTHARSRWPHARFVGKTEDDILVSLPAVLWELRRLPTDGRPIWWGLMVWTGNGDVDHLRVGCWGGSFEDNPTVSAKGLRQTLGKERECPDGAKPLAPAPTHEIDIRSAALVREVSLCSYPNEWLQAMGQKKCPNDCAAVQGMWLTKCSSQNVTLAHATWTKVHSNSLDNGWRPFAPPSNLTLVLDMNLGDKKLREDRPGAWKRAATTLASTVTSSFPPLLFEFTPSRRAGDPTMLTPLNPAVAAMHQQACRWGGCHPSRADGYIEWPGWRHSQPWPAEETTAALFAHSVPSHI